MATSLYDEDLCLWSETTAKLLEQKRFDEIDLEHLAEELHDVGKSERRTLRSQLERMMLHLLKWKYQPIMRTSSWRCSIQEGRRSIDQTVSDSPSLKRLVPDMIEQGYPYSREAAIAETGLPATMFPKECPFELNEILDYRFFPRADHE
jgi:hypothetical protein